MRQELPNPDLRRRALSPEERQKCKKAAHFWVLSTNKVSHEFLTLLNETNFISGVLGIYRRDAERKFRVCKHFGCKQPLAEFEEEHARLEDFAKTYLPQQLFNSVHSLVIEATFASLSGEPMRKSKFVRLIAMMFLHRTATDPPLKDGRNEVWNTSNLKWALSQVLPEIKTPGAVTLSNLAKRINHLPKTAWLAKSKKPLTGKHLQKLFKEHGINWIQIKRDYIRQLRAHDAKHLTAPGLPLTTHITLQQTIRG